MTAIQDPTRNGVATGTMFATLDLIKSQPELARFQFRVANRWIAGAHNRSTIKGFYAAGGEDTTRTGEFHLDAGEPAILLGTDTGPNPAEYLLHALAACLTTSIVYVAAARKVDLTSVESRSPVTWTCAARSASTTSRATGSSASPCRSAWRATRRRPSCARSSSGPGGALPSTTW